MNARRFFVVGNGRVREDSDVYIRCRELKLPAPGTVVQSNLGDENTVLGYEVHIQHREPRTVVRYTCCGVVCLVEVCEFLEDSVNYGQ